MSEEIKAIEALADALGFELVRKIDRYEVYGDFAGQKGVLVDEGKCYRLRTWFECNPKQLEE